MRVHGPSGAYDAALDGALEALCEGDNCHLSVWREGQAGAGHQGHDQAFRKRLNERSEFREAPPLRLILLFRIRSPPDRGHTGIRPEPTCLAKLRHSWTASRYCTMVERRAVTRLGSERSQPPPSWKSAGRQGGAAIRHFNPAVDLFSGPNGGVTGFDRPLDQCIRLF